jgi:hypothetical protein
LRDRLHFERDVPSFAEPVSAGELRESEIYFSVMFADEDMRIPIVETLVFTGNKMGEDGAMLCCFQDLDSYRQGIKYGTPAAERASFYFQPEIYLNHIFEYEKALQELIRCSIRRQEHDAH